MDNKCNDLDDMLKVKSMEKHGEMMRREQLMSWHVGIKVVEVEVVDKAERPRHQFIIY